MNENLIIKPISYKQTWPIRHVVMYPDFPLEHVILEKDSKGQHFGGFIQGELVCVVSLFLGNKEAQFRKLATKEKHQEKGYGSKMIKHLITYSKSHGATKFWCNARENKATFYHKFGLQKTNKTYIKSGIKFVIMELNF
ncbi:GNAT family N-acetyltransferase [uncultured Maribacter sp.]|uniref:GNAT family N-acetyltransferase n=1 Tax=uncultured Maribacter sp. TaxID=431308 RepID=UPI0026282F3E|nr:GNAT family N-acetyltransferase [uncultured Maribacter sp.]